MQTQRKARYLQTALYLAGLVAFGIFLLVRVRGAAERVVYKNDYYNGRDLYKNHYIRHFRESHPAFDRDFTERVPAYREQPDHPSLESAELIVFGDSFMNFRWLPSFPALLAARTGQSVHFAMDHYPRSLLRNTGYGVQPGRVAIFAVGERGIRDGFYVREPGWGERARRRRRRQEPFFQMRMEGRAEPRYRALLQLSRLTHRAYKWIATQKFAWFGYISPVTPVYALDPPVLFHQETVDAGPKSFHYRHPAEEIRIICDRITAVRDALREAHGLEMVFMAIPSKISIHHDLVWSDATYNDFIPRVQQGLAMRGVPYIDLYGAFSASDAQLYFLSDTHWNEKGIALALEQTLSVLAAHGVMPEHSP